MPFPAGTVVRFTPRFKGVWGYRRDRGPYTGTVLEWPQDAGQQVTDGVGLNYVRWRDDYGDLADSIRQSFHRDADLTRAPDDEQQPEWPHSF